MGTETKKFNEKNGFLVALCDTIQLGVEAEKRLRLSYNLDLRPTISKADLNCVVRVAFLLGLTAD
jgi:hypothetical protein